MAEDSSARVLDLEKDLGPAVKEIASGQWTKAVPILAGVIGTLVSSNPLVGSALAGVTQLSLDALIARSATQRLLAANASYEQEREAIVRQHLYEVVTALKGNDTGTLGLLLQSALDEAGEERREQFLQLVRVLNRGFASTQAHVDVRVDRIDAGMHRRFDDLGGDLSAINANVQALKELISAQRSSDGPAIDLVVRRVQSALRKRKPFCSAVSE